MMALQPIEYHPSLATLSSEALNLSFDDEQTRKVLLELFWSRFESKFSYRMEKKDEFYTYLRDFMTDFLDEMAIELKNWQIKIHLSLDTWKNAEA